jgi:integrase
VINLIREKGKNTYEIAIDFGADVNGKRIRKYERFKGSKKEAKAREAEIKLQIKQGDYVLNDNRTVGSYFTEWLEIYVKPSLKPKTYFSYKSICEEFMSYNGHIKLKSLTPLHIVSFYNHLRSRGSIQKEPGNIHRKLTENTVLRYYAVINSALKQAVQWQLIAYNPNHRVTRPKKVKRESRSFDLEQTKELLKALDTESIKAQAIIRLALDTGCRKGELTGLEWSDIDLKNGLVNINKTTQTINHQIVEGTPKNNSSIRKLYISIPTIEVLLKYKEYNDSLKNKLLDKWEGTKKVFTTDFGGPIHPDTPRKLFNQVLIKHKLPIINFHALRHTSASLQLSTGSNIADISRRLGHADISTTLNIYSHAYNSGNKEIVNKFNAMFNTKEG